MGETVAPVAVAGDTEKRVTGLRLWPSESIFTNTEFHYDSLSQRLREV